MSHITDKLNPRLKKVFDENFRNFDLTASDFFDKQYNNLSEVECLEVFAMIKMWQTQDKISNMLWNESERLGDIYYLRKAGNWTNCDFYMAAVREEDKEYINEHKEMWEEKDA